MPRKRAADEPRRIPPRNGLSLSLLLLRWGWQQNELAERMGVTPGLVSQWVRGDLDLAREKLDEIAAVLELPPGAVDEALEAAGLLYPAAEEAGPDSPCEPGPAERRAIERAVARVGRAAAGATREELPWRYREEQAQEDRAQAAGICQVLAALPAADAEVLIETVPYCQIWAVAEALAHASERAAPASPPRALELADLALKAAALCPGGPRFLSALAGYCWGFVGNARRVSKSGLARADQAFVEVERLWGAGDAAGLLSEARLLDLEASLRRAQRRFEEALALHARAAALAREREMGFILLNQSATLEQMGDPEGAIVALSEALPHVDGDREPRLVCVLKFNLASCLIDLDRPAEAAPFVPEVRELAIRLANAIDLTKVLWLQGRLDAGLGRRREAIEALRQVRRELMAHELPYDIALATLDLAAVLAEEGRTAEVRELAGEALPRFVVEGITREALASLHLFVDAARREAVTAELARDLARQIKKAQGEAGAEAGKPATSAGPPSRPLAAS
jgi:transcriptional regulator with XRE-family HTH domain